MTVAVRRLGTAITIPINAQQTIYTVPAGKVTILRSLFQATDGNETDTSIGCAVNGVGFIWDQKVSLFDSRLWPLSTVITAGMTVTAQHGSLQMATMLQGVELDVALEGRNLWRQQFNSVTQGTTQLYTVPAGKRVRVREVVICNHGDTSDWSVFINGIGHFVKLHAKPRVGNVIGVDMSVNAGEQIGASVIGPPGHVFLSGVIEDA